MRLKLVAASLLLAVTVYGQGSQTPIYNGLLQSDLDAAGFKILSADLSDYAGANLTWNVATNQFDVTAGGGSGTVTSITGSSSIVVTPSPITTTGAISLDPDYEAALFAGYDDRLKWDGGATGLTAATGRTSLGLVIGTNVEAWLGNPSVNGYVLSSTTGGTRSWIAPGGGAAWGSITGTLSAQTDLQTALDAKQPLDADLTNLAGKTGTNTIYYRSAADTWSAVTIGSNMTFTGGTLDSVAGGSGTVTTTGSPTTGRLTQFSGTTSITNVDNTAGVVTFIKVNSDDTFALENAATFRTSIGAGTGSGTVTDYSAGDLSPLFTTTEATTTTTPALSFALTNAAATTVFGRAAGTSGAPTYSSAPQFLKIGNLTTNGFVKTGSSDGTLSVDTSTYLTANQNISLTGDVTGGPAATSIATTIGANKVTLGMMATLAADSIIGNTSASPATPVALTSLPWADTGDVTRAADGKVTVLAAGNAGNLNSGTLLAARMPALTGEVTSTVNTVATTIADGITVANWTLTTPQIPAISNLTGNGFVKTGGTIGTLSVDTSTYLTTASAASTYQPLDTDLTALAAISGVQGDVIYHNGTSWVRLGAGTSGQQLTTGGAAANPSWAAAGSGGGGTPGGSDTQVQFNDGGAFGGDSAMVWDKTNHILTVNGSTTTPTLKIGTLEFQPYALNNSWFGDNSYYDGSGFKYRATGKAGQFYFFGDEGQFRFYASGSAGAALPNTAQMKINYQGVFAVGSSIVPSNADFTTSLLLFQPSTSNLRIGSGYGYAWSSTTDASGTVDIGLSRNNIGVVEINNGTAGTYRDLKVRNLEITGTCTGCGAGGGAPTTVDYLVGTADGTLSNEIVVGTSPGGELGGTWAAPTIDDSITVASWTLTTPTIAAISNLTGNGFVKTSGGVGTLSVDTATYLTSANIDDTAFAGTWNAVTTIAPSKNAVYDYMLLSDTDADGKINVLDLTAGLVETDGSGVVAVAVAGTDYVSPTGTETLTNKRVNPRVTTITSNATLSPNGDTTDIYAVSALATAVTTISAPTGTPVDEKLIIRVISDSSVRAISGWNAIYRFSTALPAPSTDCRFNDAYMGIHVQLDSREVGLSGYRRKSMKRILLFLILAAQAQGAITFLNVGTLGSSGNAITVGQPATPAVGDIWIMVVQSSNQAIATPTNATAGTWAQIATQVGTGTAANAGATRLGLFWHRWTTTTGNITLADTGDHQLVRIAAYRGVKASGNPWNAVVSAMTSGSYAGSFATVYQGALTTTANNCKLVLGVAHSEDIADSLRTNITGASPASSIAERIDNTLATGTGGGIALGDGDMATAGSINGTSQGMAFQLSGAAGINYVHCAVALEEAVATPTPTPSGNTGAFLPFFAPGLIWLKSWFL